jgi:MFS family permease
MHAGLSLQAGALGWLASEISTQMSYAQMILPFIMAGAGMALVFAPSANAVLSAVRTEQAGQASGATNAIREAGGVLGVAVLASVFTAAGGYASPHAFLAGIIPALWVGTAVLAAGALVVLVLPFRTRVPETVGATETMRAPEGARAMEPVGEAA